MIDEHRTQFKEVYRYLD